MKNLTVKIDGSIWTAVGDITKVISQSQKGNDIISSADFEKIGETQTHEYLMKIIVMRKTKAKKTTVNIVKTQPAVKTQTVPTQTAKPATQKDLNAIFGI